MQSTVPHVQASRNVYFESGVTMEFDSDHRGYADRSPMKAVLPANSELMIRERIHGDARALQRDYRSCTGMERHATLRILAAARIDTISLIGGCDAEILDWDDTERALPNFARWRTIWQLAWHIADTESRFYPPACGIGYRDRLPDLLDELAASGVAHARRGDRAAGCRRLGVGR